MFCTELPMVLRGEGCVCMCVCVCVCVCGGVVGGGFGTWPDGRGTASIPGHSEGNVAESSVTGPPPPSRSSSVGSETAQMGKLRFWG